MKDSTGIFYAKYSHGLQFGSSTSGKMYEALKNNILNNDILNNDIKVLGINVDDLKKWTVLNIGTGREAVVFSSLGAKMVEHYDLSEQHVKQTMDYAEKMDLDNLKSFQTDVVMETLPLERYELVYANGVVHHFSDPVKGIVNLVNSLKNKGYMYLCFYRSGTFKWFVNEMIRSLISYKFIDDYYRTLDLRYGFFNGETNNLILTIMDEFFVPNVYLYSPTQYIDFLKKLGCTMYSSSRLEPIGEIVHDKAYHSCVLCFQKQSNRKIQADEVRNSSFVPKNQLKDLKYTGLAHKNVDLFWKIYDIKDKIPYETLKEITLKMHQFAGPQHYLYNDNTKVINNGDTKFNQDNNQELYNLFCYILEEFN